MPNFKKEVLIEDQILTKKPQFNYQQVAYLADWAKSQEVHHDFKVDGLDRVALCSAENIGMRKLVSHLEDIITTQGG